MSESLTPLPESAADERPRRRGRGHGGITLADVARLAGVSPMSASRALNSPDQVSEQIRARVKAAVARTGYVANRVAGALASQRSRLVAAVVPSIAGPVFQDMVQSLIAELAASGYQLMLGQSGYGLQEEDALLEAIIGRRPDGIVLGGVVPSPAGSLRLRASGIPVVQTWDRLDDPIDMLVGFSHEAIATAVAHFLVGRGHRRLAFVGGDHERAQRRAAAFLHAAQQASAPDAPVSAIAEAVRAPAGVGNGREALRSILQRQPGTQAVFCSSDVLALGVLTEARAQGLDVPGQLAVIGFGDLHFAADIVPALTTVHVDAQAIGRHAARFIVGCAGRERPADTVVDVGFTIIERESA